MAMLPKMDEVDISDFQKPSRPHPDEIRQHAEAHGFPGRTVSAPARPRQTRARSDRTEPFSCRTTAATLETFYRLSAEQHGGRVAETFEHAVEALAAQMTLDRAQRVGLQRLIEDEGTTLGGLLQEAVAMLLAARRGQGA